MRENYGADELSENDCAASPIEQFENWFQQAQAAGVKEPNAMTLATSGASCRPSARVVLLKDVSDLGFVFYTNRHSRKGEELAENPFCALTFYWPEMERQVRIEGRVERLSRSESEVYFRSRPRGSRLGAWASEQSRVLTGREVLEARLAELERQYDGQEEIPMPPSWGGYRVIPDCAEFWQGRLNRLHDRLRYRTVEGSGWVLERLAP
ncbi:MAG: pyridoxamine 5'-phosphate oxidase [Acidobacteriaceae bacterium]|nr:pyridoxamine 5'-phosphate oxidase [Acidobacteriaceae bacterium]MBV8571593.1 pyridoxamine 5'-phosphate oxidase [Acidobacteriaceae bacterium]